MKPKKTKYTYVKSRDKLLYAPTYKGIRKYFYGDTDAEIDRKVSEWKKEIDSGNYNKRKFVDVANQYWERKSNEISPTTYNGYKVSVQRAIDAFGNEYIADVTPQMIYQWLDRFKLQGYSAKAINNTKSVLKGIFDLAFICQDISSNPCFGIPNVKGKSRTPRQPASEEDVEKIEQIKNDSLMARMYYFMLYTGARRGEAAAIQQKDIDLDNKTIKIDKTLVYGNLSTAQIKDQPKTMAGIRKLELLDNVLEILPHYDNPETYIFYPSGFPTRKSFEKGFEKFRKENGITATPHQLRHSFASMLHSANVDVKDAQGLLGHANVSVTQDIYTHLEKEHTDAVRENLNEYVKNHRCCQ